MASGREVLDTSPTVLGGESAWNVDKRQYTFRVPPPVDTVTGLRPTPPDDDSQPPEAPLDRTVPGRGPAEEPTVSRPAMFSGLIAGTIATVVMTAFRVPISRSPPPPARLAAIIAGGEPTDHLLAGLLGHLAYGTVAGGVFGVLAGARLRGTDRTAERRGAILGSLYGLALSVFGSAVLLKRVLRVDPDPDERFVFHVSHLIYGLTLGILVASRS